MVEAAGTLSIRVGSMDCWQCGCETTIVTGVDLGVGTERWDLKVADFDAFPDLIEIVQPRIPGGLGIGPIKRRYSRALECAYLSNGCAHCDALVGQHYEHHAWPDQKTVCAFAVVVAEQWRRIVASAIGEEPIF